MSTVPEFDEMSNFVTGIAEIDAEARWVHLALVSIRALQAEFASHDADSCAESPVPGRAHQLQELLYEVMTYLHDHIVYEERSMKAQGFSATHRDAYAHHVKDHADLTQVAADLIFKSDTTPIADLLRSIESLVWRWLTGHIREHDRAFANVLIGSRACSR